jgi:predicted acyltransferase (DUF342 family)
MGKNRTLPAIIILILAIVSLFCATLPATTPAPAGGKDTLSTAYVRQLPVLGGLSGRIRGRAKGVLATVAALPRQALPHIKEAARPVRQRVPRRVMLVLAGLLFVAMTVLPFLPGIREFYSPRDDKSLFIDRNYERDARYFEKSFVDKLYSALAQDLSTGMKEVTLSRKETVGVFDDKRVAEKERVTHLLYVKGDLSAAADVVFIKEMYVEGRAVFGERSVARGVACRQDIVLAKGAHIIRWATAHGNIRAAEKCSLGARATAMKRLEIGPGSRFKYLCGYPVATAPAPDQAPAEKRKVKDIGEYAGYVSKAGISLPPGTWSESDWIVQGDMLVRHESVIEGNIKAYGNVELERAVHVTGNIFADGNIIIGRNCHIEGNVFSNGRATLAAGTQVGRPGTHKSVIGKKLVLLQHDVKVYGHIRSDEAGKTV